RHAGLLSGAGRVSRRRRVEAARRGPARAVVSGSATANPPLRDHASSRDAQRAPPRAERDSVARAGGRDASDRLHRLDPGWPPGAGLGLSTPRREDRQEWHRRTKRRPPGPERQDSEASKIV